VAEAFFGEHMTTVQRPAAAAAGPNVPAAVLRRYAGQYEMTTLGGMLITVELEDGQLRLQVPGQPALPLQPTSATSFDVVGAPARVTFNTAAGGVVEGLTFHQEGEHPGRRVAEDGPAVDLGSYAGRYFSAELETYYDLSVEDDRLVIRHRRFGSTPLTHTEGDSFSGSMPVTSVVFRRDDRGNVTAFEAGNGRARGIVFEKVSR
jgi:hypothetical protein